MLSENLSFVVDTTFQYILELRDAPRFIQRDLRLKMVVDIRNKINNNTHSSAIGATSRSDKVVHAFYSYVFIGSLVGVCEYSEYNQIIIWYTLV